MEENFACCGCNMAGLRSARIRPEGGGDAVRAYDLLEGFKRGSCKKGLQWNTFPANTLTRGILRVPDEEHVILWTPHITKEMVVEAAKQKRLLLQKQPAI